MSETFGWHLVLDLTACEVLKVIDGKNIENFAIELVKRIDMVPYGAPQVVHFGKNCVTTAGYTLIQLIETSAITGHFLDESGDAFLDIFSCKEYDVSTVLDCVREYFNPTTINTRFLERKAL